MRAAAAVGGIGLGLGLELGPLVFFFNTEPDRLAGQSRFVGEISNSGGLLIMRWRWLSRRWSRPKVRRGPNTSMSTSPNLIYFFAWSGCPYAVTALSNFPKTMRQAKQIATGLNRTHKQLGSKK